MTKKIALLPIFVLLFFARLVVAQEIIDTPIVHDLNPKFYKTFSLNGRVIGMNLENVSGASVTNKRTAESVNTDGNGLYKITAAKGDTLFFAIAKYAKEMRPVKNSKENLNVILMKRKANNLPAKHSRSDYDKAKAEDDELYRILEKDAKLEGKWNY
jgi:hypothetical protein